MQTLPEDSCSSIGRRDFVKSAAVGALAYSFGCVPDVLAKGRDRNSNKKPNLIFVFSDQQSSDMLGCYGNKDLITPNFDAFAAEGVRFNHCISTSPVCTPYRGMLLSGQHPLRNGTLMNDFRMEAGNGDYFAEVMRDGGYACGYFGKWHLYGGNRNRPIPKGPYRYGFDDTFLSNNCTLVYDAKRAYYWDEDGNKHLYGVWEPDGQTKQAMKFLEKNANKPFAMFLSWHPPHNWGQAHEGYDAPAEFLKLYDPDKLTLRPNVEDTPEIRRMYQGHMAMITNLDQNFGQLMQKLRELELDENTIVVFTADHGDLLKSHGYPGHKTFPENVSSRVPLIMRWPAKLNPRVSNLLFGPLDFMPTLLSMMGLDIPARSQGRNLADAICNEQDDAVESVPFYLTNWRGIYTPRYTYAFDLPEDTSEGFDTPPQKGRYACLYDRENDPYEMNNLYDSPDHEQLRDELHAKTLEWMKKFGDTGVRFEELKNIVLVTEDNLSKMWKGKGRLIGRPEDVLKRVSQKR